MLAEKKEYYEKTGKTLQVTPAKYKPEFPWLKEVDSLALCNAQLHLQTAYKNFFRDASVGFPGFKSKKNPVKSYTTNCVNGNISPGLNAPGTVPALNFSLDRYFSAGWKIKTSKSRIGSYKTT